jgi:squalene cyclase
MLNIDKSLFSLLKTVRNLPEEKRMALVLVAVTRTGISSLMGKPFACIIDKQLEDGGWSDIPETALSSALLKYSPEFHSKFRNGIKWLTNNECKSGGWGLHSRDVARIPVTGLVLTLLPELAKEQSLLWLEQEWKKDLYSATKLTYKGAFTLMALAATKANPKDTSLITTTIEYLTSEQNDDGGFAPWKDHPIGSEPWSTGIALIGLAAWPDLIKPETLEKALIWLAGKQLPNGLWPCHYIEEGSAYCYWGAVEALKYLKRIGRSCAV